MTLESLTARIHAKIAELEGCTHQMCSMSESVSEGVEARMLRQLLCDDHVWYQYDGPSNSWVPSTGPGHAVCHLCGETRYGR